jgi:hypothetical protein
MAFTGQDVQDLMGPLWFVNLPRRRHIVVA